jgi:uncharacterized damage-inducible protein DinB
MNRFSASTFAFALASAALAPLAAQQAPAGVRGEILMVFNDAADKLAQLAEAIPQDKFTWRPAAGVRSVSEVFLHVAGSNDYVLTAVGVASAAQGENDIEKSTTDKTQVIAKLKESIGHVRAALQAMPDTDLDKATKLFGVDMTYRGVGLLLASHVHEHLGQMIAYARSNSVVPPWSRAGQ